MFKSNLMSQLRFYDANNGGGSGANVDPAPAPATDPAVTDPATKPDDGKPDDSKKPEPADPTGAKYTDDDVNEIVNKKFAKWKAEEQAKVDEAKKLAKMDSDQKRDYELKQAQQQAQEAQEKAARYEMSATARKLASDSDIKLTEDDLKHIVTTEADSTKANVDWLKDLRSRIREDVKTEFLQGNPPKSGGAPLGKAKGNYGTKLAKQNVTKENPYFQKPKL